MVVIVLAVIGDCLQKVLESSCQNATGLGFRMKIKTSGAATGRRAAAGSRSEVDHAPPPMEWRLG